MSHALQTVHKARSANAAWLYLLNNIILFGNRVAPRGKPCLELLAHQSTIDMSYPIVTVPERKMGYKFQAAEAAFILSGDNKVSVIAPYSKEISKFSDDGETFFGFYGEKINQQFASAVSALREDLETRQSVINIWRENPPKSKDIPCTISIQFVLRNMQLHCIATMRSSDAWLGWVYDVFNFTMISARILQAVNSYYDYNGLEFTLGNLYLTAGSQHIYSNNEQDIRNIILHYSQELLKKNGYQYNALFRETEFKPTEWFGKNIGDHQNIIDFLWECANTKGSLQGFSDLDIAYRMGNHLGKKYSEIIRKDLNDATSS